MAHLHEVHDSDIYFVIDPITREIKTESKKILLVQGDHNAERFTFRLPKLIEFHDMTECDLVTIHFINISGTQTEEQSKGVYEVTDVHVCSDNEDEIEFTWLISENATRYAGTLAFCIRFECTTNGIVDYRWQTGIHKNIAVTNSYFNGNEVTEAFPDVLAQWKDELFEAGGDSVVNVNVAREEALEAIRTEGTTQIEAIQEAGENIVEAAAIAEQNAKNVLANAIKGHLKGEVVTADDVSSVEHEMSVKVCGKNLLNLDAGLNGSFIKNSDGTYTIRKINGNRFSEKIPIKASAGDKLTAKVYGISAEGHGYMYIQVIFADGTSKGMSFDSEIDTRSILCESEPTSVRVYIPPDGVEGSYKTFESVQIEKGTEATEYTPYIDPTTVTVSAGGETYIPEADGTVKGIFSTVLADGISTDTEGVVIDCEYIVDTKTYIDKKFEELKTAILAEE